MKDQMLRARVDQALARRAGQKATVCSKISPQVEAAVKIREKRSSDAGSLYDYVREMMRRQPRFVKKSGLPDEAGFYAYARIDKSTWSSLRWNLRLPSKETLLKLVIALRLNEEEANELMRRGSNSLNESDPRDRVILALLDISCYEIEDVYDVLEEYGTNGAQPFKNIYGVP